MNRSTVKYRPSLTASQITHLLGLCKSSPSTLSLSCARTLSVVVTKIQNDSLTPAYVPTARETLEASLGLAPTIDLTRALREESESREKEKSRLYMIWLDSPSSLSVPELERVQEYRFEENLMSQSESQEYEAALFKLPTVE